MPLASVQQPNAAIGQCPIAASRKVRRPNMRFDRTVAATLLFGALMLMVSAFDALPQTGKNFGKPVLVTSSGQALDAFTVKTLLGRAGIENNYDPKATA